MSNRMKVIASVGSPRYTPCARCKNVIAGPFDMRKTQLHTQSKCR